jgi:hypothetical protein
MDTLRPSESIPLDDDYATPSPLSTDDFAKLRSATEKPSWPLDQEKIIKIINQLPKDITRFYKTATKLLPVKYDINNRRQQILLRRFDSIYSNLCLITSHHALLRNHQLELAAVKNQLILMKEFMQEPDYREQTVHFFFEEYWDQDTD